MGMREECKHFQSRTYANGEAVRFCVLGLAPDQPWSCPEGCVAFERRFADVGWAHGSIVAKPVEKVAPPKPKAARLSFKDQRELEGMEAAIEVAEKKKAALETELADTGLYLRDRPRVFAAQAELEAATTQVERLYKRWQELQDRGA